MPIIECKHFLLSITYVYQGIIMKAPGGFDKCTLCLSQDKLTYEHIIPESIGGFLKVDLQCAKCNNERKGVDYSLKQKRYYLSD